MMSKRPCEPSITQGSPTSDFDFDLDFDFDFDFDLDFESDLDSAPDLNLECELDNASNHHRPVHRRSR